MTTRSRLDAELATQRYTRRHAREIVTAMLGNNAGTVVATASTRWYWLRLHGDANQVVRAWNAGFVPPVNNLNVDVEIVKGNGITDYQILGVSINKGVAADVYAGATGMHALQHQRRDFNTGGFDPLDIYTRAIIPLRARAQATPDMTLYVEPGFYSMLGVETYWAGGNSPAFVAPATGYRIDLLYLNAAGALTILTGTAAPFAPTRPATPTAGIVPIAYVYLAAATTTVTEYDIEDARVAFGSSGAAAAILTPGTLTVSTTNIATGNHTHAITSSSNPGAAAAILATNASGITQLVGLITDKVYPSADSTTAMQLLKANGTTAVVTIDTTNSRVGIGVTPTGILDAKETNAGESLMRLWNAGTGTAAFRFVAADGQEAKFQVSNLSVWTAEIAATDNTGDHNLDYMALRVVGASDTNSEAGLDAATKLILWGSGNVVIGTAAIATNATDGFLYIPSCNGVPSGTPTAYTGRIPIVYDTANNDCYAYNGAWKKAHFA